ncbi:monocarboxylate transporter 11-like [Ptychodera flava]|uniref:monocarboxylate transporter 11-like n=1 Tax=Ptychodera flava TaxID=63121 RepID=UPI00396A83FE
MASEHTKATGTEESTPETELKTFSKGRKVIVVCCNVVMTLFCLGLNIGIWPLLENLRAFFEEYHYHREIMDIKWAAYLNVLMVGLSAPLASWLMNRKHLYRIRIIAMSGALLSTIGVFVSGFAKSVEFLCVSYGVIAGSGFGLVLTAGLGLISMCFPKHGSTFANAIAFTGSSIGVLIFPPIIYAAADTYGTRPVFFVLACLNFQMVVAAALFPAVDSTATAEWGICERIGRFRKDVFCRIPLLGTIALATFFVGFGYNVTLLHLRQFVVWNGSSEAESSSVFIVCGVFLVIGQVFHGSLSVFKKFGDDNDTTYRLFMFGVFSLVAGVVALTGSEAETFAGHMAVGALIGLGGGIYMPLVFGLAKHATSGSKWMLTDELAICLPMYGLGAFIGLIIGDVTNKELHNGNTSFFLAGASLLIVAMMTSLRCLMKLRSLCKQAKVSAAESRPTPQSSPGQSSETALQTSTPADRQRSVHVHITVNNPRNVNVINAQGTQLTAGRPLLEIGDRPDVNLRQLPSGDNDSRPRVQRRAMSLMQ